jgi:hypothetical protein
MAPSAIARSERESYALWDESNAGVSLAEPASLPVIISDPLPAMKEEGSHGVIPILLISIIFGTGLWALAIYALVT